MEVTAGIDIGGIDTEIGLVSASGECFKKTTIITSSFSDARDFLRECLHAIRRLGYEDGFHVNAIGIAAPNGNHYTGAIENAVNLRWKGVIPVVEMMKQMSDLPIAFTNDANAAAVGEKRFGGAKDMDDFVVVTLGAGLGSGIYINGQLLTGHMGLAGEMGHMIMEEDGRMCNTGRTGCLEAYASVTGIRRTVIALLASSVEETPLRHLSLNELRGEQITNAARAGDPIAVKAFEYTGKVLGRALANVVSLLDPEAIFIGGGLARAGDLLFEPVRQHLERNVFPPFAGRVKLLPSMLLDDGSGGVLGAGALAWEKFHTSPE